MADGPVMPARRRTGVEYKNQPDTSVLADGARVSQRRTKPRPVVLMGLSQPHRGHGLTPTRQEGRGSAVVGRCAHGGPAAEEARGYQDGDEGPWARTIFLLALTRSGQHRTLSSSPSPRADSIYYSGLLGGGMNRAREPGCGESGGQTQGNPRPHQARRSVSVRYRQPPEAAAQVAEFADAGYGRSAVGQRMEKMAAKPDYKS